MPKGEVAVVKRLFKWGTVVVLLLQVLMIARPVAFAGDPRDVLSLVPPLITFTGDTFKAYSGGVEIVDLSAIPQNADIVVAYAFDVEDAANPADDVTTGDYFTISLPTELTSIATFEEVVNRPFSLIYGGTEYTIATLTITSGGVATITFQEDINDLSEVSATFDMQGALDEAAIGDGDIVSFSLRAGGTVYTIGFVPDEPPPPPVTAGKSGTYNPNTNEITWTVTVDSGGPSITVEDVYVVDTLGADQAYKPGTSSIGEPTYDAVEDTYTFFLDSVTGATSFTYKTTPTDGAFGAEGSVHSVANAADVYAGAVAGDPIATAAASVSVTTDWIRKSGARGGIAGAYVVEWTITLNNNNRTIPAGSTVIDALSEYLALDGSSVKRDGSDPVTAYGDSFTIVGQTLTYTFNADAEGQLTITFTTAVSPSYYTQQTVTSFTNTATITVGGVGYSATSSGVGVPTSLLVKSGDGYVASTQRITWRMQVNSNGQAIGAATITDTIGGNQVFAEDFGVRLDGSATSIARVANLADLTSAPGQYHYEAGVLTVYLGDLTPVDKPVARFQTTVTNPAHYAANSTRTYSNPATLTGGGISPCSSTGAQSVQSTVLAKTGVGYNYVTRRLSWRITVNQNNMPMPAAVVTDTIPAGQAYVPGSLLIGGAAPGAGVLAVALNTLTITLGAISSQTVITFDTVVTDLGVFMNTNGNVTFGNAASLVSGIAGAPMVSVTCSRTVNNKTLNKDLLTEYIPANGYIEWEIYVNSNQAPIANVTLSDTLQPGLELDVESVTLYLWNQDENGVRTVGDIVPLGGDYGFEYDYGTRLFVVRLPDGAQGYYLKFKTDVLAPGTYSNTVAFAGSYTGSDNALSAYSVTSADIESGATGTNGRITVTKTDPNGVPITTGAVFELLDSMRNVKKTLSTDASGQAVFDRLKLRTYYIREKTPPLGYALSTEEIVVTLTSDSDETRLQFVSLANSPLTAGVRLTKTDVTGNGLPGGRFSIYAASDTGFLTPLQTVLSDADGLIEFTGLTAGSYVVRETRPPAGYKATTEVRAVTLALDVATNTLPDVTVAEPFLNVPLPGVQFGSVQLLKVDDQGDPLGGAELGLYNQGGELLQTAESSDATGAALFSNVPLGTYEIREIAAPAGYVLSEAVVTVSVLSTAPTVTIEEPFINVLDALAAPVGMGTVELRKVDGDGHALKGAQFGLYNSLGTLVQTAVSSASGVVLFSGVPYGVYTAREIAAPEGYELSDTIATATVSSSTPMAQADPYVIVDTPAGAAPDPLPNAGSPWNTTRLLILGVLLILAGIGFSLRRRFLEKG